ncbi:UDP-glucosyltransferase 2-like [Culex pipiens pallens]|uniref:UDP-glucosyltransferase 2-like n=1 Tax=Culex pipiens pallens TaxID=42434 RepID=UPI001952EE3D|nr:UDP-glucosyltransferase 2-like [Culex pipiens pallens]
MWQLSVVVLLAVATGSGFGANILYIAGVPSPSHFIWHRALMYGLAAKGHNVTALSVDVEDNPPPDVHFIKIEGVYEALFEEDSEGLDFFAMGELGPFAMVSMFNEYMVSGCEVALRSEGVRTLVRYPDDFKFDVIINDFLLGPCLSALAQHKFGRPPYIGATAFHGLSSTAPLSGAYSYSGLIPHNEFDAPEGMSYMNFLYNHWEEVSKSYQVYDKIDEMVRRINPDIPHVGQIEKDARIILLNSHPVVQYSEPAMPNVISVGGMQITEPKQLPDDLKSIVENAEQGVILFSLGTNVRSDLLGNDRVVEILNAMEQLPQYNFLWKFESDSMPMKIPKNVHIRKWIPQNDLLAHPNSKLFITHSGLLSTQEAIWHGVPIIGFPAFADQNRNINYCVQLGVARRLSLRKINSQDLVTAIRQIMTDQSYRDKMTQLSKLFRDQKESPLERAVWWVEWVLRNSAGSTVMQSNAVNIGWISKYSLDVIVPLVMAAVVVLQVLVKLASVLLCRRIGSNKVKRE